LAQGAQDVRVDKRCCLTLTRPVPFSPSLFQLTTCGVAAPKILRMNSDNVIRIGEVNKPGASAVLLEWLPLLLVACAGRLASLASVASFALLPHSHSA